MKAFILGLASTILAGLLMFFVGKWDANRENRIQYLEYLPTTSTDILRSIKEIGDSVNFVVNDKSIKNLSELSIHIFNSSNRDFENIPVYIDLYSPNGNDIRIFSSNHYDHNGSKESIEQLTEVSKSIHTGGERFGYNLKIANRSSEPVFRVRYLVEGASVPQFEVQTNTKGVSVRQFVAKEEGSPFDLEKILLTAIAVLSVIVLGMSNVIKSLFFDRKYDKHMKELERALKKTADARRDSGTPEDADPDRPW